MQRSLITPSDAYVSRNSDRPRRIDSGLVAYREFRLGISISRTIRCLAETIRLTE